MIALRVVAVAAAIIGSLIGPALAARITLSGDLTYSEKIALPANAILHVSLVDIAEPQTPKVEAEGPIANGGIIPLSFKLGFDDSILKPGHSYGIIAEIAGADGRIWFRNAEPYAVDPVAPAGPVLVTLAFAGQIVEKEQVQAAQTPPAVASIVGVTWVADSIAGAPTAAGVHSTISIADDMRAGGRGGCNSWFAQAAMSDNGLAFSAVAATKMACLNAAASAQEASFFAALAATRQWVVRDGKLVLEDEGGADLAVFSKSDF